MIGNGCKYCTRKPEFDTYGYFCYWDSGETVASGAYTSLSLGVDENGKMVIVAYGDDQAVYYPSYCPACGRKLK